MAYNISRAGTTMFSLVSIIAFGMYSFSFKKGIASMQGALKQYALRKDKNLRVLMKYAEVFHVEKVLRQYLEVLLC